MASPRVNSETFVFILYDSSTRFFGKKEIISISISIPIALAC